MKIAIKVATFLEALKDYRKVIKLYFHLEIPEKVMQLLNIITEGKDCKKIEAMELYSEFAQLFKAKGRTLYFELCIEKAKLFALDHIDKLV